MSFTAGPQSFAEHEKWLQRELTDATVKLFIAEDQGVPVGTGRIDHEGGTATLSLTVAPLHRGNGYATAIIQELTTEVRRMGIKMVFARVRGFNVPSLRAFLSAGYEPTTPIVRLVFRG